MRRKPYSSLTVVTALVLAAALGAAGSASAQILIAPDLEVYTTQASYAAASTSIVDNITFNGLTSQNSYTSYPSLSVGGVSFTTPAANNLFVVGPGYVNSSNGDNFNFPGDGTSTLFVQGTTTPVTLTATLPVDSSPLPGVTAVGTNIGSGFSAAPITVTITLAGDPTPLTYVYDSANASTSGLGYLGFTTTDGTVISSITFSDSTTDLNSGEADMTLDNFTYGVATVAPEPASLGLLGLGLFSLLLFRLRRFVRVA